MKKMENWKWSLITGIFFLIIAIFLVAFNQKITIGAVISFIIFIFGIYHAMRSKP
ncbi:hypothetical protein [Methanobrevibacter sp.]|uniref:hypothetical protein n=1 Tax=Methanobrevibacter sp. TaxID=66852 RepID=UPI002E766832|nr:hypothetical protein [Methanobrevibacter sp.]